MYAQNYFFLNCIFVLYTILRRTNEALDLIQLNSKILYYIRIYIITTFYATFKDYFLYRCNLDHAVKE